MPEEQQLIFVGNVARLNIVDDMIMPGSRSNGSTIVECPQDYMGPAQEASNILFYIYTPTIHWHTVKLAMENGPAWAAIEWLADETSILDSKLRNINTYYSRVRSIWSTMQGRDKSR